LQHAATRCNTLQHAATRAWIVLEKKKASHGVAAKIGGRRTATHCIRLIHTATHCNTLQHNATQAWIALEEKKASHGVAFKLEEVGLYGSGGKPAWFLKVQ